MSGPLSINEREMGLHVVGTHHDPSNAIFSCNGIQNNLEDAKAMGDSISQSFGGREVYVFHNPTTFSHYLDSKQREKQETKLDTSRPIQKLLNRSTSTEHMPLIV